MKKQPAGYPRHGAVPARHESDRNPLAPVAFGESESRSATAVLEPEHPAELRTRPAKRHVVFNYSAPAAREVFVAGTFNYWSETANPMTRQENGEWVAGLDLPPGRHEYRFVVDGLWCDDPKAGELVGNRFGSSNAVVNIQLN